VIDFLEAQTGTQDFLQQLTAMMDCILPQYQKSDRHALAIGIGCTGGQHRSVYVASVLHRYFQQQGITTTLTHRDLSR
ncbi:MAG: RNase adapter RapZ, partial [Myxococcota bacterium]